MKVPNLFAARDARARVFLPADRAYGRAGRYAHHARGSVRAGRHGHADRGPRQIKALANDTEFGLGASIWTRDLNKAHLLASQIDAGTVWINTHNILDTAMPFGGVKLSGLGVNSGRKSFTPTPSRAPSACGWNPQTSAETEPLKSEAFFAGLQHVGKGCRMACEQPLPWQTKMGGMSAMNDQLDTLTNAIRIRWLPGGAISTPILNSPSKSTKPANSSRKRCSLSAISKSPAPPEPASSVA